MRSNRVYITLSQAYELWNKKENCGFLRLSPREKDKQPFCGFVETLKFRGYIITDDIEDNSNNEEKERKDLLLIFKRLLGV